MKKIAEIEKFADDHEFLNDWSHIKWFNKQLLAKFIKTEYGLSVSTDSIFDVHIKRFHEYKRQLLNVLHVITLYNRIKENPRYEATPRTVIFAGKAAPAYHIAKLIIKLIHSVADVVNNDPVVGDKLKVVFIANYGVSLAERIIPAADLSEQISTAGLEASGTGNMKFALNGALTIGTMDGANIEIREEVGDENIFIFGLLADEVLELRASGYNPRDYYDRNPELRRVINMIAGNIFSPAEPGIFQPIIDSLMSSDYYMLLADYEDYIRVQDEVAATYRDRDKWNRMSLLNTARIAKFSSDRAIMEYAKNIWNIKPVKVKVDK
jgi:starch phosphorylase